MFLMLAAYALPVGFVEFFGSGGAAVYDALHVGEGSLGACAAGARGRARGLQRCWWGAAGVERGATGDVQGSRGSVVFRRMGCFSGNLDFSSPWVDSEESGR